MKEQIVQVIALPTEKGVIASCNSGIEWITTKNAPYQENIDAGIKGGTIKPHHLYHTTEEPIKDGNWYIVNGEVHQYRHNKDGNLIRYAEGHSLLTAKKIVATTNPELFSASDATKVVIDENHAEYHTLPIIPTSFIEYFVKEQGKVESVVLEMEEINQSEIKYITSSMGVAKTSGTGNFKLKLTPSGEVIWHEVKEKTYTREDIKEIYNTFVLYCWSNDKSATDSHFFNEYINQNY